VRNFDDIIVTCEHGGHRVPAAYRTLFVGRDRLLRSHRGFDPGALELARILSRSIRAPLIFSDVTRLLVELNRSPDSDDFFSAVTRSASAKQKLGIVRDHYLPYRRKAEKRIADWLDGGRRVLHLSIHSFTPVFRGRRRDLDIGLLYDPARTLEAPFCKAWRSSLHRCDPSLVVRANQPYRGTADGFTTYLRTLPGAAAHYAGIELEVNQRFCRQSEKRWRALQSNIVESLAHVLSADS
jgi:predicted N-formylglutamate amidohydrolase